MDLLTTLNIPIQEQSHENQILLAVWGVYLGFLWASGPLRWVTIWTLMTVRTFLLSVANEQLEVCKEAACCLIGHSPKSMAITTDPGTLAVLTQANRVLHDDYMILADYASDQHDTILALEASIRAQGHQIERLERQQTVSETNANAHSQLLGTKASTQEVNHLEARIQTLEKQFDRQKNDIECYRKMVAESQRLLEKEESLRLREQNRCRDLQDALAEEERKSAIAKTKVFRTKTASSFKRLSAQMSTKSNESSLTTVKASVSEDPAPFVAPRSEEPSSTIIPPLGGTLSNDIEVGAEALSDITESIVGIDTTPSPVTSEEAPASILASSEDTPIPAHPVTASSPSEPHSPSAPPNHPNQKAIPTSSELQQDSVPNTDIIHFLPPQVQQEAHETYSEQQQPFEPDQESREPSQTYAGEMQQPPRNSDPQSQFSGSDTQLQQSSSLGYDAEQQHSPAYNSQQQQPLLSNDQQQSFALSQQWLLEDSNPQYQAFYRQIEQRLSEDSDPQRQAFDWQYQQWYVGSECQQQSFDWSVPQQPFLLDPPLPAQPLIEGPTASDIMDSDENPPIWTGSTSDDMDTSGTREPTAHRVAASPGFSYDASEELAANRGRQSDGEEADGSGDASMEDIESDSEGAESSGLPDALPEDQDEHDVNNCDTMNIEQGSEGAEFSGLSDAPSDDEDEVVADYVDTESNNSVMADIQETSEGAESSGRPDAPSEDQDKYDVNHGNIMNNSYGSEEIKVSGHTPREDQAEWDAIYGTMINNHYDSKGIEFSGHNPRETQVGYDSNHGNTMNIQQGSVGAESSGLSDAPPDDKDDVDVCDNGTNSKISNMEDIQEDSELAESSGLSDPPSEDEDDVDAISSDAESKNPTLADSEPQAGAGNFNKALLEEVREERERLGKAQAEADYHKKMDDHADWLLMWAKGSKEPEEREEPQVAESSKEPEKIGIGRRKGKKRFLE